MLADNFLGVPGPPHIRECVRRRGDRVRFDTQTQAFGVIDRNGVIRTFYKPIPCTSLPAPIRSVMRSSGRCHDKATDLIYFQSECDRW